MANNALRLLIKLLYLVFLLIPLFVIYTNAGGLAGLTKTFQNSSLTIHLLLRLTGLYAFFLIFLQIIHGGFMPIWQNIFGPKTTVNHENQGLVTYLLMLAHPMFFLVGAVLRKGIEGVYSTLIPQFVTKTDVLLNYGRFGLTLITLAVIGSYFRHISLLNRHWLKLHVLNYAAFVFLFLHSWNMGSDTQIFPLNYIYPAMAVLVFASVCYRFIPRLLTLIKSKVAPKPQILKR